MDAVALPQAEGDIVDALHGLDGVGIVTVGDHAEGGHLGKLVEGFLNIRQILEVIQVVLLHVQHQGQSGEEIQEGVAVFAAFQQNGVAVAHPVAGVKQGQIAADHNRGVQVCLHQDVGQHGSGGGFAVGAGNADGVLVGLHDLAPGLSPLKHGNARRPGGSDLGVVVVGSRRADNALGAFDIPGIVPDGHRDSLLFQFPGAVGGAHVRAGDLHAHALEHQAQGAHGNATDAHQMHMAAGYQILGNFFILKHNCPFLR